MATYIEMIPNIIYYKAKRFFVRLDDSLIVDYSKQKLINVSDDAEYYNFSSMSEGETYQPPIFSSKTNNLLVLEPQ